MIKAAPPPEAVTNSASFTLVVVAVAICAVYLAFRFFRENRQLARDLRRYQQQVENLLLENRKLTAPKPPPRKTPEQWEAEREAQQAERQTKQLRDVQLEDVTFITQKVMSGGELDMFYAGRDVTGQSRPINPYPFYIFPQVSLGEIMRTSSPQGLARQGRLQSHQQ